MASRSRWARWYWWPVRMSQQTLFAEALSQTLDAGLETSRAIMAAGLAVGARFRSAIGEMATHCRSGYTLNESLSRTGINVSRELLAVLAVARDRNDLADALAEFGRRGRRPAHTRLAAAVWRRRDVVQFAAILSRLLSDCKMTVKVIEDAARLAAGEGSKLFRTVQRITGRMSGSGMLFAEALDQERWMFDRLFRTLVASQDTRDGLRAVLSRLGEVTPGEPVRAPHEDGDPYVGNKDYRRTKWTLGKGWQ